MAAAAIHTKLRVEYRRVEWTTMTSCRAPDEGRLNALYFITRRDLGKSAAKLIILYALNLKLRAELRSNPLKSVALLVLTRYK